MFKITKLFILFFPIFLGLLFFQGCHENDADNQKKQGTEGQGQPDAEGEKETGTGEQIKPETKEIKEPSGTEPAPEETNSFKNILKRYKNDTSGTREVLAIKTYLARLNSFIKSYVSFIQLISANKDKIDRINTILNDKTQPYQKAFEREIIYILAGKSKELIEEAKKETNAELQKAIKNKDDLRFKILNNIRLEYYNSSTSFIATKDKALEYLNKLNEKLKAKYDLTEPNDISKIRNDLAAINLDVENLDMNDLTKIIAKADVLKKINDELDQLRQKL